MIVSKKDANKKQKCGYIYKEEHNIEGSTIIISGGLSAKAKPKLGAGWSYTQCTDSPRNTVIKHCLLIRLRGRAANFQLMEAGRRAGEWMR